MVYRLSRLDFVAIALSFLCLLHCLATPFVILAWPFLGLAGNDSFHLVMAVALLVLAMLAFVRGYGIHRRRRVLILGGMGLSFLFLGLFVSSLPLFVGISLDAAVTVIGSLFLIYAHYLNFHGHRHHRHSGKTLTQGLQKPEPGTFK